MYYLLITIYFRPGIAIIGIFKLLQFLLSRFLVQKIDTVNDTGQPTTVGVLALNNRCSIHVLTYRKAATINKIFSETFINVLTLDAH